ncbi:hypothetical protein [Streptomyces sp. Ru62]|uniref:hypothetical protein n=1 Tax=Streptomyces sp. Ru62 TaxID=2080745 RepID=UPI0011B01CD1|nr:hypothetical protein [Streptomyces sp. Ru62]
MALAEAVAVQTREQFGVASVGQLVGQQACRGNSSDALTSCLRWQKRLVSVHAEVESRLTDLFGSGHGIETCRLGTAHERPL